MDVEIEQKIENPGIERKIAKLDINQAVKMRYINGNTYREIGERFGVSHQAVEQALAKFKNLFAQTQTSQYIADNLQGVLANINAKMLLELVEPVRLKDKRLTLNQLAFAQSSIDRQLRIESGKPDSISASVVAIKDIEDLRSQANQLTKQLREEETPVDNLGKTCG